jgi:hypothetical protein
VEVPHQGTRGRRDYQCTSALEGGVSLYLRITDAHRFTLAVSSLTTVVVVITFSLKNSNFQLPLEDFAHHIVSVLSRSAGQLILNENNDVFICVSCG